MQQKSAILKAEHLVMICNDFHRKEEVITARTLIEQFLNKRLPTRQGSDMIRTTLEDILKTCIDPNLVLPVFYGVDLHRIPPVDVTHCDVFAILRELQALRAEVRELADIREELQKLKQSAQPPSLLLPSDGVEVQDAALKKTFSEMAAQLQVSEVINKTRKLHKSVVGASTNNKTVKSVAT